MSATQIETAHEETAEEARARAPNTTILLSRHGDPAA
jgi:hypothetical protein